MLLVGKVACTGIAFLLLATGISGPRSTPLASAPKPQRRSASGSRIRNNVIRMQQTLQDKGHYRGKVDGVIGLRTRASIRAISEG